MWVLIYVGAYICELSFCWAAAYICECLYMRISTVPEYTADMGEDAEIQRDTRIAGGGQYTNTQTRTWEKIIYRFRGIHGLRGAGTIVLHETQTQTWEKI